ncbi:probable ATP-dependent RNA helicase DDX52 [Contarinia nasturtii]|uniref:probable ATP-dependent RNA helicase DDX52 n=1 Tax=Contarinia nasturtii TaxID=265458 RepID=UPI0012D41D11|nr:probable ATP-dependent RNA helicase DDX52 [Contarinia nasturtii]
MNTKEIFKQLTVGAVFKPERRKVALDSNLKSEIKVEDEIAEETTTPTNAVKKEKIFSEEKQKMLHVEKVNHIRNKYHINVHGTNPADPVETFDELINDCAIPRQIVNNLISCGYKEPTPIQMQAIPIMSSGKSLMACAPTGSGKTAAFLVPIIRDLKKPKNKGFRALILCPTRELAKQTQRECQRLVDGIDLKVHTLNKINQAEAKYGPKSNKQFDILITTPNRVCFLLEKETPILDLSNVEWLVLDEADKLFEEGKNSFRDQFNKIHAACSSGKVKVGLFSATWTMPVSKWGKKNTNNLCTISIGQRNSATDLVDQELLFVGNESGKMVAFRNMLREGLKPPVLVFVDSKDRAQQLYSELIYDAINVDVIHADRTQQQRDDVVKNFREGKVWVLISTELIGRGIDFLGVNLVINYDFPPSAISYIHRIGRTGRAGRKGKAITYFTQDDKPKLKSIANILRNSGCKVPEYMLTFKKQSKKVRRKLEKTIPKRQDIAVQNPKQMLKKKGKFGKKTSGNDPKKGKQSNGKSKEKQENDTPGKFVKLPSKRKAPGSTENSLKVIKKKQKIVS